LEPLGRDVKIAIGGWGLWFTQKKKKKKCLQTSLNSLPGGRGVDHEWRVWIKKKNEMQVKMSWCGEIRTHAIQL
jgi:hypothetical protein